MLAECLTQVSITAAALVLAGAEQHDAMHVAARAHGADRFAELLERRVTAIRRQLETDPSAVTLRARAEGLPPDQLDGGLLPDFLGRLEVVRGLAAERAADEAQRLCVSRSPELRRRLDARREYLANLSPVDLERRALAECLDDQPRAAVVEALARRAVAAEMYEEVCS